MKRNLYYSTVYKRQNVLKMSILNFFLVISSYPRLMLEVFLRKNMGERYFNLASAITVAIIFGIAPFLVGRSYYSFGQMLSEQKLYYAFLALFLVFSYLRHLEVKREPSVFDFARFSASSGRIHPIFFKIQLFGKKPSIRTVEIYYEAMPFFLAGILLAITEISPLLGLLFIICSLIYSFSHSGAYMIGDDFIMDRIDEIISNEDLAAAFIKDEVSPRGFRWYGKKPNSQELREEYFEDICFEGGDDGDDDDDPEAV